MSAIASVYAVFADAEEAERIGRAMIEARLAACVNILGPCRSIYHWQGKIAESDEVPAIFKTTMATADALMTAIAQAHSYEVPAIALWPIDRSLPSYAAWVTEICER